MIRGMSETNISRADNPAAPLIIAKYPSDATYCLRLNLLQELSPTPKLTQSFIVVGYMNVDLVAAKAPMDASQKMIMKISRARTAQ
jgi:hypothetical protein